MTAEHTTALRVRYSETDQMGTFYNSRVLKWFEVGRPVARGYTIHAVTSAEGKPVRPPRLAA